MPSTSLALLLLLLVVAPAWAQMGGGHAPGGSVRIQDEGTLQGKAHTLNCTGAGIACSVSGGVATVTAGGGGTQVTIDWDDCGLGAAVGKYTCKETVTDAGVSATSKILITWAGVGAGRQADEAEMDFIACHAVPASGSFTLYCRSLEGPTHGTWKVTYVIG